MFECLDCDRPVYYAGTYCRACADCAALHDDILGQRQSDDDWNGNE